MQKVITLDQRKALPNSSGVYLFRDGRRTVLYIGKATQLRSRVASYFTGNDSRGERIFNMVAQSKTISFIETDTVLEAVILEANLIRKLKPKYNVDLKDDKSFTYIGVTKEDFPRFEMVRERELETQNAKRKTQNAKKKNMEMRDYRRVYGPYTSKKQAETVLKILRRIFPFHSTKKQSEKGCLYSQIGLCPAPHEGRITKERYRKNIRNIEYVLRGQKKRLITTLEKEMNTLSQHGQYEEAAKKRDEVFALKHIRDIALLAEQNTKRRTQNTGRVECYDISHISGESPVASMIVFENGEPQPSEYRKFSIKYVKGIHDVGMMREVLARRLRRTEWPYPKTIVLDGGQGHVNMAEKLMTNLGVQGVAVLGVAKGPTRKKVDAFPSITFPPPEELIQDRELLESVREEAHRFAITYHRKKRSDAFL